MDGRSMELRDGRTLAWSEAGDPDGTPVFAFHGTPGSRHQMLIDDAPIREAGVRWIVPDRPGYGQSTFVLGRRLVDWPADVAAMADRLGVGRFAVLGLSGGGPHAAVCAHGLPERVTAAAIVSGVGPLGGDGAETGMMPANQLFARVARKAPWLNSLPFGLMAFVGHRFPDQVLKLLAKQAPPPDAKLLGRADVADAFRQDFVSTSGTTGRAAAQDFALFAKDWGFRLEDIRVPVHVWQADADVNVPPAHAERQAAAIPGAVLHMIEGEGHFMIVDHIGEILASLLAAG